MDEIIKELGFSDGFSIPVANDENKALEREIKEQQKEREVLLSSLEDGTARLSAVKKYLENIVREQEENQKLIFVYDCQVSSDNTAVSLAQGQIRSLTAEERDLSKTVQELKDRQDTSQDEIARVVGRLDQLREQVRWDQAALQAWSTAAARVGEDHAILQQFSQQDQARFSHLELKRQQLRQEVGGKRLKYENLAGDVSSLEQSLEKIGNLFQSQYQDRQALVDQWHGAARVLHQRDEEIHRAIGEVGALRTQAKQRMRELEEQKTFYANEEKNNKEVEREVSRLEREARQTAATVRELETAVSELTGQLLVVRGSLRSAARQIQNHRSNCRRMAEQIMKKRGKCQRLEQEIEVLHLQMQETHGKKLSATERVRHLEEMKSAEERACERLAIEHSKLQEKVRLLSEELLRLRTVEREQRGSMAGLEATAQSLRQRLVAALAFQRQQQDILYKAEINYLEKDMQYRRMLGRADPEEVERCEWELKQLETAMADARAAHQLLERECYRIDQEYRRLVTALEADDRELNNLRSKRQELVLLAEGGEKQVATLRAGNQDSQVDENVVRLRVSHYEKAVRRVGGQLYSLEKQRLELEEAVRERTMEVAALLDVLGVRKRALAEQLSNLITSINVAKLKVEHLQTKHALSMQSLGSGEEGEVMTVTKLKIQAAQERYELQQMGDQLDARIRNTEREITAMENTLQAVIAANSSYKSSLSRVPADGAELQEKESLQDAYMEAVEILRGKRKILQELQEATSRLQDDLESQLELEASLLKEATNRASDVAELTRRLGAQDEKQNRAARDLRVLLKQIYGLHKPQFQTLEEKDMALRELRDQNQAALQQLGEVAGRIMEAAPVVGRYLRDRGMSLPLPSARRSTSSRASSLVAASSCYTIDSLTLGETKPQERVIRRPSVLRSEKKIAKSKSKVSESIDIVDLVLPQPK